MRRSLVSRISHRGAGTGWHPRHCVTAAAIRSHTIAAFVQGLALSLGLIVAIGAQNAFVRHRGLRREPVGTVVLFCARAAWLLRHAIVRP